MIAAFDHPFLSGLIGDDQTRDLLGVAPEIDAMAAFEIALAGAEAEHGLIPSEAADAIARLLGSFRPDINALKAGVARDGVVVPELVRQMRVAVGDPHAVHLHYGATSQDVIDTAMVLRVRGCLDLLQVRLDQIIAVLDDLDHRFGSRAMMGFTRMQAAISITVSNRIASWRDPVVRYRERLGRLRSDVLVLQFGGAVGTQDKLGAKGPAVRASLARQLNLADAPQWHSQRDRTADIANWLAGVTGSLGKFGQDIALMAQAGGEIELSGGGASSAMAHKQNPVDAETLITLARFNAVQISGMHQAMVHEQERSGAAWALEWMILPQMLMATGTATRLALRLAGNVVSVGN